METLKVMEIKTKLNGKNIYGEILLDNDRTIYIETEIIGEPKLSLKDIKYLFYLETGRGLNIKEKLPLKLKTEVEDQVCTLIEEYNKEIGLLLESVPTIEY